MNVIHFSNLLLINNTPPVGGIIRVLVGPSACINEACLNNPKPIINLRQLEL